MKNTKKAPKEAPMWARLREAKKTVTVCRSVIRELNNGIIERDAELQAERQRANHYEESYKWAMNQLAKANDRTGTILEMLAATAKR